MKNSPEKLYDLKELRTVGGEDEIFIKEMIDLFISQNEKAMLDIGNLVVERDYVKIRAIIHSMKPTVMVMGVITGSEIIKQIEQLNLAALDESLFSELVLKLGKVLQDVNEQLRSI